MKTKNNNTERNLESTRNGRVSVQLTIVAGLIASGLALNAQTKVRAFCDFDAVDLGPNLVVNGSIESGVHPWRRFVNSKHKDNYDLENHNHPGETSRIKQIDSPFSWANPNNPGGSSLGVFSDQSGTPWTNGALCELTQNVSAHSRFHVFLKAQIGANSVVSPVINAQRIWGGSSQGANMLQTDGFTSYLEFDAAFETPHFLINIINQDSRNQTAVGCFGIDDVEVYARETIVDYPDFEMDVPPFWNTDNDGLAEAVDDAFSNPGTSLYAEISAHAHSRVEDGLVIELNRDVEAGEVAIVGFWALSLSDDTNGESHVLNVQQPGNPGPAAPVVLWSHAWKHVRFEAPFTEAGREILINTVSGTAPQPNLSPGRFLVDDLIVTTYTPGQCP